MKHTVKKVLSILLSLSLVMGLSFAGMGQEPDSAEREKDKKTKLVDELSMSMEELSNGDVKITVKTAPFSREDLQNQLALTYDPDAFSCSNEDMAIADAFRKLPDLSAGPNVVMANGQEAGQIRFAFIKRGTVEVETETEIMTVVFHKKTIREPVNFCLYYWYRSATGPEDKWLVQSIRYPAAAEPSDTPSPLPVETASPEPVQTPDVSTEQPSEQPTEIPTEQPSEQPTEQPSEEPTEQPTEIPTEQPSEQPTEIPTEQPTEQPTEIPTEQPSEQPTEAPTEQPVETASPDPTEKPVLLGDITGDGRIQTSDAIFILRMIVYGQQPSEAQLKTADVNGDKAINTADAICILRKVVNPSYSFPVEENKD